METYLRKTLDFIKEYQLEIGKVTVYENYLISEFNEGITLSLDTSLELIGVTEVHFREKPFVYITNRVNSYAVDPTMYLKVKDIETLKGIAVVSDKECDYHNLKIEKHFFKKPMHLFHTIAEATDWVDEVLYEEPAVVDN